MNTVFVFSVHFYKISYFWITELQSSVHYTNLEIQCENIFDYKFEYDYMINRINYRNLHDFIFFNQPTAQNICR